jgi:L-asparaginase II
LLAVSVRSGLVETYHDGVVAVADPTGALLAWSGEIDRPFYLRSSAKPFQAFVSQESGAGLEPLELAIACASHRGFPLHVGLVKSVLAKSGLSPTDLRCPPDWPISGRARDLLVAAGEKKPRREWHNCSGKHSGFLRACVAQGWPLENYLDPTHPLQRRVVELVSEVGEFDAGPVGVDGCGAPVLRTTARAMALLFARLGSDSRFVEVFTSMHRYPAVIAANGQGDTEIAVASRGAAKGGAAGCLGVAIPGLGIGVKSWDGLGSVADVAAVSAMDRLGLLSETARSTLASIAAPKVFGGGGVVGAVESRLDLATV